MKIFNNRKKGSVLVFSLLVLAMLLSATLSSAVVVIADKSSSKATGKSVLSIMDVAVENILKRVYKDTYQNLDTLASNLYGLSGYTATCSAGVISGLSPACPIAYVGASGCGTYQVRFLDNSGNPLQCSGSGFGTNAEWRAKLVQIEAKGTYAGAVRAIKVGIKPPTASQTVVALTTNSSPWTVPSGVTSIKVWAIGAGGGGAGSTNSDGTSGGGGGAGGVAYSQLAVTGGQTLVYSLGSSGIGGTDTANGGNGGNTSITISGTILRGNGGNGGNFNSGSSAAGGTGTGGTANYSGGTGAGASGDTGGGGGGGLNSGNGTAIGPAGGTGGSISDMSGLFAALTTLSYPTVSAGVGGGAGSTNIDAMNGTSATGFGSGGGGSGYYGGNGGNGYFGGGGGGAAGYTAVNMRGGNGGAGVIIISTQ